MESSYNQIVSLIWNIADDVLRYVFLRRQYRDVILPMVVLRRLDALLEPIKDEVEEELQEQKEAGLEDVDEDAIKDITGLSYFNTSKWTLNRLKSQATDDEQILYDNFAEYLSDYSSNVKDVLHNFDYYNKAKKLADNHRLLAIIERITELRINLTDRPATDPDGLPLPAVSNHEMGTIFEELLRRFNEENNEEAGEYFTPRDAISLLAHLVFDPVKNNLPKIITLHDCAEGSGGMITEGRDYLLSIGVEASAIQLSGTEINLETYAICKSDLIIKGVDPEGQYLGNTITDDHFRGKYFGFQMTNLPYGKSWGEDNKKIYNGAKLMEPRFELASPTLQDRRKYFEMADWEKMYWLLRLLIPELKVDGPKSDGIKDSLDDVDLNTYGLRRTALNEHIDLAAETAVIDPTKAKMVNAGEPDDTKDTLDKILDEFNEHHFKGWEATPDDQKTKLISIAKSVAEDNDYQTLVVGNPDQNATEAIMPKILDRIIRQKLKGDMSLYREYQKIDDFKYNMRNVITRMLGNADYLFSYQR